MRQRARRSVSTLVALWLVPFLGGCSDTLCPEVKELPDYNAPTSLAVGDSILAWNSPTCRGITDYAALDPDVNSYIKKKALIGAQFSTPSGLFDVRSQYEEGGPWQRVVMTGGANDLRLDCSTDEQQGQTCDIEDECLQIVNDLEVEMADFIHLIQNDGPPDAEIVIIGYYELPDGATRGFNLCNPYMAELNARYEDLANADPDVTFMVTLDLMDYEQHPDRFAPDLLHPSPAGAEKMGQRLAPILAGQ